MSNLLIRFWFSTEKGLGIGVTAYSIEDAIAVIQAQESAMRYGPNFEEFIEDIDVQELDQGHVVPNMGVCTQRGVWFPNLNY